MPDVQSVTSVVESGGHGGSSAAGSLDRESSSGGRAAESPSMNTGMKHPPPEQSRRFSMNNPSNMEVFKRESGNAESFDRSQANPDTIPKMK
jgi:hypothetical protein